MGLFLFLMGVLFGGVVTLFFGIPYALKRTMKRLDEEIDTILTKEFADYQNFLDKTK